MKQVIKIISLSDAAKPDQPEKDPDLGAAIDLDIFNADKSGLDGERFWEAYWRTQHVYGSISEGQPLGKVFSALSEPVFEKLQHDVTRLADSHAQMADEETNDIFGMIVFLLTMEKADPEYNPIEQEGYEAALAYFSSLVRDEAQRRTQALAQTSA